MSFQAKQQHKGEGQMTCYEAVEDLDEAMRYALGPEVPYYVLGGTVSPAIADPDTVFDHATKRLIAKPSSAKPILREENGTTRDLDTLVKDVLSPETAKKANEVIKYAVRGLIPSVFGLDKHEAGVPSRWTSIRTVDDQGILRYELAPLEQIVPPESYDPWQMELPSGKSIQILNPAAHVLAYRMRSISVVRYKDREKLPKMEKRIYSDPVFKEQIMDGPLKSWKEFADTIEYFGTGLHFHPDPAITTAEPSRLAALKFFVKSRALAKGESYDRVVKLAQEGALQKMLAPIIGTK